MSDSPFADEGIAQFVANAPLGDLDVAAMRTGIAERARTRTPGPRLPEVRDLAAGGVPARLYRPSLGAAGPLMVWLHSGGWTVGSIESHDRMCRRLAAASGVAVLSLEYRLAPENPWPASVDDTVNALIWVAADSAELGFTPSAVGVGGDSAGGALAALACQRLRDSGSSALPNLQVLAYANTDLTGSQPSVKEKEHGWGLNVETVRFFNRQWVADEHRWGDVGVSPLVAPDLTGLPAAIVVTAEHDPLRDEGEAYAERLRQAGVPVVSRREPGLIHNFLLLDEISPACAAAADRLAAEIGERLRA